MCSEKFVRPRQVHTYRAERAITILQLQVFVQVFYDFFSIGLRAGTVCRRTVPKQSPHNPTRKDQKHPRRSVLKGAKMMSRKLAMEKRNL